MDFTNRISERFTCSIAVQACDTLNNRDATVVDLSRHGAQIRCAPTWEQGERIHLDVDGEFVWAIVAWTEIDRMGLKFMAPLRDDSALYQRIEQAKRRELQMRATAARIGGFGRRAMAA